MKHSCAELKGQARDILLGKYGTVIGAFIISSLIPTFLLLPFEMQIDETTPMHSTEMIIYLIANVIISLISIILICGIFRIHLRIARNEEVTVGELFAIFKSSPHRYVGMNLLIGIIAILPILPGCIILIISDSDPNMLALTGIGALLLLIGLIFTVKISLQYILCNFIMIENPKMPIRSILRQSRDYMKGNILRYLYLSISFIGYTLLVLLSLGLASLWVTPYIYQTQAYFYLDIINENAIDETVDDGYEFETE